MRPSIERANEQLDPRQQLANTPPPQSTTPGLHSVSIHQMAPPKRTSNCSLLIKETVLLTYLQLRERGRAMGVRHWLEHAARKHDRRRVDRQSLESVPGFDVKRHNSQV